MDIRKDYFSFSQMNTWLTSPKEYYKKYVLENTYNSTKYQKFGKDLMDSLEFDREIVAGIPKELLSILKGYQYEEEITIAGVSIGSKKDFLGYVDAISLDKKQFVEIKTGKHAWTQELVDKNEQVLFYAMLIRMKYGVIPSCKLVWVETFDDKKENGREEVKFTSYMEVFYRNFSISELDKFEKKVLKAITDIEEYDHVILSFDAELDSKLLALLSEKKRIENDLEVLKAEMLIALRDEDTKYGITDNFNITKASRKSWTYSESLASRIKESAKDIKKFKTEEEKNGTAKQKESEYLLIKPRS